MRVAWKGGASPGDWCGSQRMRVYYWLLLSQVYPQICFGGVQVRYYHKGAGPAVIDMPPFRTWEVAYVRTGQVWTRFVLSPVRVPPHNQAMFICDIFLHKIFFIDLTQKTQTTNASILRPPPRRVSTLDWRCQDMEFFRALKFSGKLLHIPPKPLGPGTM